MSGLGVDVKQGGEAKLVARLTGEDTANLVGCCKKCGFREFRCIGQQTGMFCKHFFFNVSFLKAGFLHIIRVAFNIQPDLGTCLGVLFAVLRLSLSCC